MWPCAELTRSHIIVYQTPLRDHSFHDLNAWSHGWSHKRGTTVSHYQLQSVYLETWCVFESDESFVPAVMITSSMSDEDTSSLSYDGSVSPRNAARSIIICSAIMNLHAFQYLAEGIVKDQTD